MNKQQAISLFDTIKVWQRGDQRAPHKPLLALLALGKLANQHLSQLHFSDVEEELKSLLREFGPTGSENKGHFPFWHLQGDGLWELHGPVELTSRPLRNTALVSQLRQPEVTAGFSPELARYLIKNPDIIRSIAQRLVSAHFPETIQEDVLAAVGLGSDNHAGLAEEPAEYTTVRKARDPQFRIKVLTAYEYRCCVCGHDLRLGTQPIGLEAAHIKWFQAGGPDIESNGLALCSLHHKIFDMGAFTVTPDNFKMQFSNLVMGSASTKGSVLAHHGQPIIHPQNDKFLPDQQFLTWHASQVFKGASRSE